MMLKMIKKFKFKKQKKKKKILKKSLYPENPIETQKLKKNKFIPPYPKTLLNHQILNLKTIKIIIKIQKLFNSKKKLINIKKKPLL
jgi:hypothetical protein